jgi:hypothetical protein
VPGLDWIECPMPLKTIIIVWDGHALWGPFAVQTEADRNSTQSQIQPTHWLPIPPAPRSSVDSVESREQEVVRSLQKRGLVSPNK